MTDKVTERAQLAVVNSNDFKSILREAIKILDEASLLSNPPSSMRHPIVDELGGFFCMLYPDDHHWLNEDTTPAPPTPPVPERGRVLKMNHDAPPLVAELLPRLDAPVWPPAYCSICRARQYASPSGTVCVNGHGGADSLASPN